MRCTALCSVLAIPAAVKCPVWACPQAETPLSNIPWSLSEHPALAEGNCDTLLPDRMSAERVVSPGKMSARLPPAGPDGVIHGAGDCGPRRCPVARIVGGPLPVPRALSRARVPPKALGGSLANRQDRRRATARGIRPSSLSFSSFSPPGMPSRPGPSPPSPKVARRPWISCCCSCGESRASGWSGK